MAGQSKLRKILPDLLVIFSFLFLMTSILTAFYVALGWINLIVYIPAIAGNAEAQNAVKTLPDSDHDLLPDIIETTPKGVTVMVPGGSQILGWGTNTDPHSKDTDHDFFTDALESKLGTDSHNWFMPGAVWIVDFIALMAFLYYRYLRKEDKVKEYIRNEEEIQASTSNYAIGGTSIFGKKGVSDLSDDERADLVANDSRFRQLTDFNDVRPDQRISKGKGKKIRDMIIATIIIIALWIGFFGI